MKIGIVGVCDQRHMSLISLYTELFDRLDYDYELICVDRYGDRESVYNKCPTYICPFSIKSNTSRSHKLVDFLRFSFFASKQIKQAEYDYLVVWNENTIVLLANILLGKYRGRYCVNIRDNDYKWPVLLNMIRKRVIENSSFTTVPSPALIGSFPVGYPHDLVISLNNKVIKDCEPKRSLRSPTEPLRISFIGKIRFFQQDEYLMKAFGNDKRFILQFIGAGSEQYRNYIEEHGFKNIVLHEKFSVEKTSEFLNCTDVMAIHYGDVGDIALPIKFSYGPSLYFPNIVTKNTHMADIGVPGGFCFEVDDNLNPKDFADQFFNWYRNLDFSDFCNSCDEYCNWVQSVNQKFEQKCLAAINSAASLSKGEECS